MVRNISKFRKDLSVATIASMLSFIISLALAPVMSRWYEPADYGTFAVINNIATFTATLMLFSLPNALPMELNWHRRVQLLRALAFLAVFAFLVSALGVIVFLVLDGLFNGFDNTEWAFLLLPLLVFAIALHRISQGWANADGAFLQMAKARVVHPLIAKPFAISASMLSSSNPVYLVVFEVAGYLVQAYLMLKGRFCQLKWRGIYFSKRRMQTILGVIKRHRDFSLFLNFVHLLALGFIMMQTVILSLNYTTNETGLYTLAMSMTSLPIQLIAMATASIIYHKLIHIAKNTPELLFKKTILILVGFITLGVVPYFVIYVFGPELFGFVFGKGWSESGTVASLLALPLFLGFLLMPISSVFRVTKTIKLQFIIDFVFIIPIVVIFYIVSCSIPFYDALKVLALAMSLHGLSVILLALYVTWNTSQQAFKAKSREIV